MSTNQNRWWVYQYAIYISQSFIIPAFESNNCHQIIWSVAVFILLYQSLLTSLIFKLRLGCSPGLRLHENKYNFWCRIKYKRKMDIKWIYHWRSKIDWFSEYIWKEINQSMGFGYIFCLGIYRNVRYRLSWVLLRIRIPWFW